MICTYQSLLPAQRRTKILDGFSLVLLTFALLTGCASVPTQPPIPVAVSVSPSSPNVLLGNSQQFTVTVTGTTNTNVSWSVNGTAGGNSTVGTINSAGLYAAPKDLPAPADVIVTATSQADSTKSGNSNVTIASDISVSIQASPARGVVETSAQLQLTAAVHSAGNPDSSVLWSVNGVQNGNSSFGTISTTGADTAIYNAPSIAPSPANIIIEVISSADPSKSASLTSTVTIPTPSVLVAGGATTVATSTVIGVWANTSEVYDVSTQSWIPTQNPIPNAPSNTGGGLCAPNVALLGNGQVLLAGGGCSDAGVTTNAASLFDPATNQWAPTGSMNFGRDQFGMITTSNGTAMAIAGCSGGCEGPNAQGQFFETVSKSAEVYSAQAGTWTAVASLNAIHGNFGLSNQLQGSLELQDGRVLACGGSDANVNVISTCEIYDPVANTWTTTGALPNACEVGETCPMVLLPNGNVLLVNGDGLSSVLFSLAQGTWKASGSLMTKQVGGTLTVLGNGLVLLTGGSSVSVNPVNPISTAELYDPADGTWRLTQSMSVGRFEHVAAILSDGRVLVAGGQGTATTILSSAEIYDPSSETWTTTAPMSTPRLAPSVAGLVTHVILEGPTHVLVAGGQTTLGSSTVVGIWTNTAEVFNFATHTWTQTQNVIPNTPSNTVGGLCAPNAALLGNGKVLLAGGGCSDAGITTNAASLYDPTTNQWTATGSMNSGRDQFGIIATPSGNAIAIAGCAGGCEGPNAQGQFFGTVSKSSETYSAQTGTWSMIASLNTIHGNFGLSNQLQGAIRLLDGRVLACGGSNANTTAIATCEIYDPTANSWTATGGLPQACEGQTCPMVLLPNGTVLAITGDGLGSILFDPSQGSWISSGSLMTRQVGGTLTMLGSGLVLLTGGSSSTSASDAISNAELYDPAAGTWRLTASMSVGRFEHAVALLPDGRVLAAGGQGSSTTILSSAEIYDPSTETWTATASMSQPRMAPCVVRF